MSANPHADRVAPGAASPNSLWRWWLAIALCSLALYAATANRGPQWQDPGFFILRVLTHESLSPLGLALSHPLHHWLGRLAVAPGLLEPCLAITLVSALAAAVAVANVFGCVWTLTRQRFAALLAAGSLAMANTFWQMATRAECYTVSAALLAGECWCVAAYARTRRPRFLCGALLLNGLGWSNHNLALLTLPGLVVLVVLGLRSTRVSLRWAAAAAGMWIVGSLIYIVMIATETLHSGDLLATLRSALFGHTYANRVLSVSISPKLIMLSAGFVGFNFPNLLLPAAAYGLLHRSRSQVASQAWWVLLAGLVLNAAFLIRYNVPDQYMFFVPVYVLLTIFAGVGFAVALRKWSPRPRLWLSLGAVGLLLLTPAAYAGGASLARRHNLLRAVARNKPYRDDYTYVLIPWSVAERSAQRMSRQAVELAGPGGLILVEDAMAAYAIGYQVLRSRSQPPEVIEAMPAKPPFPTIPEDRVVVLVPMDRDAPKRAAPRGAWKRVGDLYKLREAGASPD